MNSGFRHTDYEFAATIGFFDGVHAGHRFLLQELKDIAAGKKLKSMVVTFSGHPKKILQPEFQPQLLNTAEEKAGLLKSAGIDEVVTLDFTKELSLMPADEFMQHILSEQLNVKLLLVGHDHHFGHNREAGVDDYRAYGMKCGIEVVQAARYSTPGFEKISSSTIRASLLQGEIETANALLTYPYNFTGLVSNGFKVGRTIGFPTANLVPVEPDKLIPGNGVYAVTATWNGQNYKAMMNIGTRPTFEKGDQTSIEVHIIDFHENIYHKKLEISFIRKIRNEQKFASVEDLITQLQADKEIVVNMPW